MAHVCPFHQRQKMPTLLYNVAASSNYCSYLLRYNRRHNLTKYLPHDENFFGNFSFIDTLLARSYKMHIFALPCLSACKYS